MSSDVDMIDAQLSLLRASLPEVLLNPVTVDYIALRSHMVLGMSYGEHADFSFGDDTSTRKCGTDPATLPDSESRLWY